MTQFIQQTFREIDEHFAREQRREIGEEATQMHLAKWFARYGKWKGFSKDPEFKKRCDKWREQAIYMMGRDPRSGR